MFTWAKLGLGIVKLFNFFAEQWKLAKAKQEGRNEAVVEQRAKQDEEVASATAARTDDSVLTRVDETRYRD